MSPTTTRDDTYVRTDFLERLAHEIRGPAGVTVGALDEIERALGPDADRLRPQLAMARRGVSRVVRAADRLQRTAQLERGDASFEMECVDVRGLVEKATVGARAIEARRKVEVELTACDTPCLGLVDAEWMTSAIGEIVCNGIRFARSRVRVETRCRDGEAFITVHDDGPGFSQTPSLERFEAPATRGGMGLSLPLVRSVVESHGGRLELSAPTGDGSDAAGGSVTLVLPLQTPSSSAPQ